MSKFVARFTEVEIAEAQKHIESAIDAGACGTNTEHTAPGVMLHVLMALKFTGEDDEGF